jgi:hypothetical protein
MKVEERLTAQVEHARLSLSHPGPRAHLGEQVSEIVEQLWRAVRHRPSSVPLTLDRYGQRNGNSVLVLHAG